MLDERNLSDWRFERIFASPKEVAISMCMKSSITLAISICRRGSCAAGELAKIESR